MPGCNTAQTLEATITKTLDKICDTTSKVCMNKLHRQNSLLIMSQCGSKGSTKSISQMVACVGQQAVGAHRAPDSFIDRSLPHFPRNSKTAVARGFVANSFYSGLSATEFFFHAMTGREGLADRADRTVDTGYMSHRLMKALEDLAVYYDTTVRNSSGSIIQFVYGDDGMDPAQTEGEEGFLLDFGSLLVKAQATCPGGKNSSLSPDEAKESANKRLCRDVIHSNGPLVLKKLSEFVDTAVGKKKWFVTQQQLEVFLDACISRLHSKEIEAGTAIGAIGAQSIGESGTQMTLKTSHFAGIYSINATLGVSRMTEIITAKKDICTPIITAKLEHEDANNKEIEDVHIIKSRIEKTLLGQVAKSVSLIMTASEAYIAVQLDMEKILALQLEITDIREKITEFFRTGIKGIKKLSFRLEDNDDMLHVIPTFDVNASKEKPHFVLHKLKNRMPMVIVKGISTVQRAIIVEEEGMDGKHQLIVEGTGLLEVMSVRGIEGRYTESNHVMDVYKALGIEAARVCIIKELKTALRSMEIDIRHLKLLADIMTHKGEVVGLSKSGISKMKDSILALASLENSADYLFNASLIGKEDKIVGVSECIIMGVPIQVGTGMFKVMQTIPEVPPLLEYEYHADPLLDCSNLLPSS